MDSEKNRSFWIGILIAGVVVVGIVLAVMVVFASTQGWSLSSDKDNWVAYFSILSGLGAILVGPGVASITLLVLSHQNSKALERQGKQHEQLLNAQINAIDKAPLIKGMQIVELEIRELANNQHSSKWLHEAFERNDVQCIEIDSICLSLGSVHSCKGFWINCRVQSSCPDYHLDLDATSDSHMVSLEKWLEFARCSLNSKELKPGENSNWFAQLEQELSIDPVAHSCAYSLKKDCNSLSSKFSDWYAYAEDLKGAFGSKLELHRSASRLADLANNLRAVGYESIPLEKISELLKLKP